MYIYIYIYMYMYMYICLYVYIYIYIRICITYIHIHNTRRWTGPRVAEAAGGRGLRVRGAAGLLLQTSGRQVGRAPQASTRNPKPEAWNPKPDTRNPKPESLNLFFVISFEPRSQWCKSLWALNTRQIWTLNPQPLRRRTCTEPEFLAQAATLEQVC